MLPGGLHPFLVGCAGFCQDLKQRGDKAGLIHCLPVATTSNWIMKSKGPCVPRTLLTQESSLPFSLFGVSIKTSELWCPHLCQNTLVKVLQTVSLSDQSVPCYYSPRWWKAASAAGAAVYHAKERTVLWFGFDCGWGACCALLQRVESLKRLEFLKDFFFFNLENSWWNKKTCIHLALLQGLFREDKVRSYCCGAGSHEIEHSLRIKKQSCSTRQHSRFLKPFPPPPTPPHRTPSMFRFILTSV